MRISITTVLCTVALAASTGCEKRTRTKNSSGSALFEEGTTSTTNVYRFVGVEQSLTDARKAVTGENWAEALAATDALLKQQPGNTEAKAINTQAKLEMPMLAKFNDFNKAATANEVGAAMRHWRAISDTSVYKERARPAFDKLRVTFVQSQIGDTRALNRAGRCDDARRVARVTGDWFPDHRAELEDAAAGCRPHKGAVTGSVASAGAEAAAEMAKAEEDKPDKSTTIAMAAPAPSPSPIGVAEAPRTTASDGVREPVVSAKPAALSDTKTLAAAMPAAAPAMVRAIPAAPPAAVPAPVALAAKIVPASELETLRLSGDREPSLPAGAKMIMKRDNVKTISIAAKVCVSDQGVPTSVKLVKSSDYGDANEKILSDIRKWRFRPYMQGGQPVPVCSATLLTYQLQ